jgi:hypothetical protein
MKKFKDLEAYILRELKDKKELLAKMPNINDRITCQTKFMLIVEKDMLQHLADKFSLQEKEE